MRHTCHRDPRVLPHFFASALSHLFRPPSSLACRPFVSSRVVRTRLAPPPLADFLRRGVSPGPPPQGPQLQEVRDQARELRARPAPPEAEEPAGPRRRSERLHGRRGGGAGSGVGDTGELARVLAAGTLLAIYA